MKIFYMLKTVVLFLIAKWSDSLYTTRVGFDKFDYEYLHWTSKYYKVLPNFVCKRPKDKWEMLDMVAEELYSGKLAKKARPVVHMTNFPVSPSDINWLLNFHPLKPSNMPNRKVEFVFKRLYLLDGKETQTMTSGVWNQNCDPWALPVLAGSNSKMAKILRATFCYTEFMPNTWATWIKDSRGNIHAVAIYADTGKLGIADFVVRGEDFVTDLPKTPDELECVLENHLRAYFKQKGFREEELCFLD